MFPAPPRSFCCTVLGLSATLFGVTSGGSAEAQTVAPLPRLSVQRTQRTVDCPDAEILAARVAAHMGRPAFDTTAFASESGYDVQIQREGDSYEAVVRTSERRDRVRTLSDPGPGCAGLADALSVTLAILLDQAAEPAAPPSASAPSPGPRPFAPPPAAPAVDREHFALSLQGAGTLGPVERLAPAFVVDVEARPTPSFSLGISGFFPSSQTFDFAPGEVDVSLRFASLRGCYVALGASSPSRASLALCPALALGSLKGAGRDYPISRSESRPWVALSAAVTASGTLFAPFGWVARVDGFLPVSDERFSIDGLPGVAYDPPPVGVAASLGLRLVVF